MDTKRIVIIVVIALVIVFAAFMFISANSHTTKIDIISNSSLQNGDNVVVILKDDYRNVYPNQTVDIKILDDSGWANKYSVVTDENGTASVVLQTFENGNYTVHADYNGTLFLSKSNTVSNLEIDDGYGVY